MSSSGGVDEKATAAGDFSCNVISGDCRLPRQAPADRLLLDIVMEDRVVRTFALGTYIREAGYDWADIDLEDITLHISLSVTHIRFRIGGWSMERAFSVEIYEVFVWSSKKSSYICSPKKFMRGWRNW